ncbi:MAG: penicillin-binding protein activator LpoB [Treponema sp.]|jgi:hypothetical protein|nr:penicillin-binding protein activator LpoB [Treponema sp.]
MKRFWVTAFLLGLAGLSAFSQTQTQQLSLDEAIKASGGEMGAKLEKGAKVAVLNFSSASPKMAAYVIDELNNVIVNSGQLTAVDRKSLDLIRQELNFNDSGEVSDDSAQQIGRLVGAQLIISGSLDLIGGGYRFRVQALEVETAAIKYSYSQDIKSDKLVKSLMATGTEIADFTAGQRAGTAALNLFFGAGSFMVEKDKLGGGITAAAEVLGVVGLIIGASLPATIEQKPDGSNIHTPNLAGPPLMIGGGILYVGGAVYGIIRAITYHRPGSVAVAALKSPWGLTLVSDQRGSAGLRLSYTLRF